MAYEEQVGVYLHADGVCGDITTWYILINSNGSAIIDFDSNVSKVVE